MNYIVLETQKESAVVLDEEGRFLKVLNDGYTVGQTVPKVTPCHAFTEGSVPKRVWLQRVSAAAACFIIALFAYFQIFERPIAAMRLKINPAFRIEWNRREKVTGIRAENEDAVSILENYSGKQKSPSTVTRELIELSARHGYLKEHGSVTIQMGFGDRDSTRSVWDDLEKNLKEQTAHLGMLTIHMEMSGGQNAPVPTTLLTSASEPPESGSSVETSSPTADPGTSNTVHPTDDDDDDDDDDDEEDNDHDPGDDPDDDTDDEDA